MKKLLFVCSLTLLAALAVSAQSVKPSDLKPLEGGRWTGGLTYLDYKSKKPITIKADLIVSKKGPYTWAFAYEYPEEPKANRTSDVILTPDGRTFDGETVAAREKLTNGVVKITTTARGEDDNRPATFRHTYLIRKRSFSVTKEVMFDGETTWFERNTYSWTRK